MATRRRGPNGPKGIDTVDGWRPGNHIFIMDLSNPANPVFLRDWALDGQQPGGTIPPHFTTVPSCRLSHASMVGVPA